jgi:CheY-like chemotaxis protein
VDDDLADIYLLEKMLRICGVRNIENVITGEAAQKYITGMAPFQKRWLPDLIFVDLKMKGIDGFELLAWLKSNPRFSQIPVVVFSGSTDPSDEAEALGLGARRFYHKTQEAHKLKLIVENVLELQTPFS